jgi:hypothetical protein
VKSDYRDPCAASVYRYSVKAGATAFRSRFSHLESCNYKFGFVFVYANETIYSDVDNSIQCENSSRSCGSVRAHGTRQTNRLYTWRSVYACQCVRVLARGVAVLRTNIVDLGLGMEVFRMVVRGSKSTREDSGAEGRGEEEEEEDRRVLNAVLAAVCNNTHIELIDLHPSDRPILRFD